ncbi:MAG TPA: hypothetical protein VEG39_16320 [Clostridia bacterium]|nr:hypothetical protein [Clostridia bacterium]
MTFMDYAEQGYVYHVINIIDLGKTLHEGIRYDDKNTYESKYMDFHSYFDLYKPGSVPEWVERRKAIFASILFKEGHTWHSHSAILRAKIQKHRCWVCNENLANFIYEPYILQHLEGFNLTKEYMRDKGRRFVEEYWNNSLSYTDNLKKRLDKKEGYDAEILIMHPIPPEDIECLYIISDHQMLSFKEWQEYFKPGSSSPGYQYSRYLQPDNISSASKTPGSQ